MVQVSLLGNGSACRTSISSWNTSCERIQCITERRRPMFGHISPWCCTIKSTITWQHSSHESQNRTGSVILKPTVQSHQQKWYSNRFSYKFQASLWAWSLTVFGYTTEVNSRSSSTHQRWMTRTHALSSCTKCRPATASAYSIRWKLRSSPRLIGATTAPIRQALSIAIQWESASPKDGVRSIRVKTSPRVLVG